MNTAHRCTLASSHGSRAEALQRLATLAIRTRDGLQDQFRTHVALGNIHVLCRKICNLLIPWSVLSVTVAVRTSTGNYMLVYVSCFAYLMAAQIVERTYYRGVRRSHGGIRSDVQRSRCAR